MDRSPRIAEFGYRCNPAPVKPPTRVIDCSSLVSRPTPAVAPDDRHVTCTAVSAHIRHCFRMTAQQWSSSMEAPSEAAIDMLKNRLKSIERCRFFGIPRRTKIVKYRDNLSATCIFRMTDKPHNGQVRPRKPLWPSCIGPFHRFPKKSKKSPRSSSMTFNVAKCRSTPTLRSATTSLTIRPRLRIIKSTRSLLFSAWTKGNSSPS